MNTLEKLNALQAGELDKVLEGSYYSGALNSIYFETERDTSGAVSQSVLLAFYEATTQEQYNRMLTHTRRLHNQAKTNAARVEVTKVVLDEVYRLITKSLDLHSMYFGDKNPATKGPLNNALALLQQLKESL